MSIEQGEERKEVIEREPPDTFAPGTSTKTYVRQPIATASPSIAAAPRAERRESVIKRRSTNTNAIAASTDAA